MLMKRIPISKLPSVIPFLISGMLSVVVTFWMSYRGVTLLDYSYPINIAHRILLGEVPYKDFTLVHSPLSFYLVALFGLIMGSNLPLAMLLLLFVVTALTSIGSLTLAKKILVIRWPSLFAQHPSLLSLLGFLSGLLSTSLLLPIFIYDILSTFLLICSALSFVYFYQTKRNRYLFLTSVASILVILTKVNIGVPLFACVIFCASILYRSNGLGRKFYVSLFSPLFLILVCFIIFGKAFFIQTIQLASEFKGGDFKGVIYSYFNLTLTLVFLLGATLLFFRDSNRQMTLVFGSFLVFFLNTFLLFLNSQFGTSLPRFFLSDFLIIFPVFVLILFFQSLFSLQIKNVNVTTVLNIIFFVSMLAYFLSQGWVGSSYSLLPVFFVSVVLFTSSIEDIASWKGIFSGVVLLLTIVQVFSFALNGGKQSGVITPGDQGNRHLSALPGIGISADFADSLNALSSQLRSQRNGTILALPMEDPLIVIAPYLRPWGECVQAQPILCSLDIAPALTLSRNSPDVIVIKKRTQFPKIIEPVWAEVYYLAKSCYLKAWENRVYAVFEKQTGSELCLRNKV